jgi:hypothetical protein
MRIVVLVALASGAIGVGIACSSTETAKTPAAEDAAVDAPVLEPIEQPDSAPPECKLVVGTGVKVCDDCLQRSCCLVINDCFSDKSCEALNGCINQCGVSYGTTSDAGVQCVRQCVKDKPDAAAKVLDLRDCESTRCGSDCK